MYRILLVCSGNTCRSPMLECLLKSKVKLLNKTMEIKSAGLYVTDDKVNDLARKVMKERGLIIRHKPTQLLSKALERVDTVITMTEQQKSSLFKDKCYYKVFSMGETVGFNIPDPYGMGIDEYRECASMLDRASDIILENLQKAGKI